MIFYHNRIRSFCIVLVKKRLMEDLNSSYAAAWVSMGPLIMIKFEQKKRLSFILENYLEKKIIIKAKV